MVPQFSQWYDRLSRHHAKLDRHRMARASKRAKDRAGWRCERCGGIGRLEVHHPVRLEDGGDPYHRDNLEVLCVHCHIEHHRPDSMTPGRAVWRKFVEEVTKTPQKT